MQTCPHDLIALPYIATWTNLGGSVRKFTSLAIVRRATHVNNTLKFI